MKIRIYATTGSVIDIEGVKKYLFDNDDNLLLMDKKDKELAYFNKAGIVGYQILDREKKD